MDSGSHMLSENMRFAWFKTLYNGQNVGCHDCGHTDGNVKIELKSVGFAKRIACVLTIEMHFL